MKLNWWEQLIIGTLIAFLTQWRDKIATGGGGPFVTNSWEHLIVTAAQAFLTELLATATNTIEKQAIQSALTFLAEIQAGTGSLTVEALDGALDFLNRLMTGNVSLKAEDKK